MVSISKDKILRKHFPGFNRYIAFKRFLKLVDVAGPDECWEWQGYIDGKGYGRFHYVHGCKSAPQASYVLFSGTDIPKKHGKLLEVCHKCDNPGCVNPNHLWLGTHKDNMYDRDKKKRHGNTKLSVEDARSIRSMYATGDYTITEISTMFDISTGTVSLVVNRKLHNQDYV
jgi:hypothetical protein